MSETDLNNKKKKAKKPSKEEIAYNDAVGVLIYLVLLLSYHPAERPIETPPGFDGTFYPPGMESVPRRYAIVRANRYMIDHVDYLIAYAWHPASNAKELTAYALRKGVVVTNLGEIRESKEE